MFPPFVQQILGAVVRMLVVWFAGYLAAHAHLVLSEDQIGQLVAYLAPMAAILAWSIYSKYVGRQKLLTALASPNALTEHEVEAMVKDPQTITPSVNTPKDHLP